MRNEKRNGMLTREMRKIRLALESKEDDEGEKATMAKGEDKLNKKQEMPVKLLQEAEGHVVTMELKNGDVYCGNLVESEDNWNCQLESVIATTKVLLNCISPCHFSYTSIFMSCLTIISTQVKRKKATMCNFFKLIECRFMRDLW